MCYSSFKINFNHVSKVGGTIKILAKEEDNNPNFYDNLFVCSKRYNLIY